MVIRRAIDRARAAYWRRAYRRAWITEHARRDAERHAMRRARHA